MAFLAQTYVTGWLQGPPEEKSTPVIPARPAPMQDIDIPRPEPAAVTAAREEPSTAPRPAAVPRPSSASGQRVQYVRLGSIDANVQAQEVGPEGFRDGRLPKLAEGCALRRGTQIPATLNTAIYSEITGMVTARVLADVKSQDRGYQGKTLVPEGTVVVGKLDKGPQGLNINSGRVDVAWESMANTEGFGGDPSVTEISLARAFAGAADGSSGLGGDVKMQWGNLFIFAAFSILFTAGVEASNDSDNAFADAAALESARIGRSVLDKYLDLEPKILVKQGTQVLVQFAETVRVC